MDILKITVVFVLAIIFLGRHISINIVMPAASILLALLFTVPPLTFLQGYALSVVSHDTIKLVLTMYMIMLLEEVMRNRGYMQRMLDSMDNLFHSRRLDISLLPMLIGFLPSAGGALFSAPMVEKAAEGTALTPEEKTFLNTLYRHIMEIFFPTYPCIILGSQIAGLPFYRLIPAMFPMAVIVYALGMWYLRKLPKEQAPASANRGKLTVALLLSLWPLLALIALIIVLRMEIYLATAVILVALLLVERIPVRQLPGLLKTGTNPRLLLMVVVMLAFKDILLLCGVTEIFPAAIATLPIPDYLVYSLMTFLISAVTGMTIASVTIALPLALVGAADPLPITTLILLSSYCGVQITPMHLCITMVSEHFKANLRQVLLKSLPPYLTIYAASIGFYLLLSSIVGL